MAQATVAQLYRRPLIRRVVSTIKTPTSRMQQWLGMLPGGPREANIGGAQATWDTFDRTRQIATVRSPKRGPAKVDLFPSGQKTAVFLRSFESYTIHEEDLYGMRDMGQPWTAPLDERGQGYVRRQQVNFLQRVINLREFALVNMFKGGFGITHSGDDFIPVAKGAGHWDIDFGIPAANLPAGAASDFYGCFAANWQTASTNIPANLLAMNAKCEERTGYPIRHIWCDSVVAKYILQNDEMQALAGTANTVFQQFLANAGPPSDGIPSTEFQLVMRGLPHLTIHVYDAGLTVNGTFTKFFPTDYALFLPEPDNNLFEMQVGSEWVRRNWGDNGFMAYGLNQWATPCIDPAGYEQKTLDRFLPVIYVPEACVYARVSTTS